jgi:hypothetical protein
MRSGSIHYPRATVGHIQLATACLGLVLIIGGCGGTTSKSAVPIHGQPSNRTAEAATISQVHSPAGFSRAPCPPSPTEAVCFTRRRSLVLTPTGFARLIATTGLTLERDSLWCLPQARPQERRLRVEHCHGVAKLGAATLGARAMSLVVMGPRSSVSTTRDLPVKPSGASVLVVEDLEPGTHS